MYSITKIGTCIYFQKQFNILHWSNYWILPIARYPSEWKQITKSVLFLKRIFLKFDFDSVNFNLVHRFHLLGLKIGSQN